MKITILALGSRGDVQPFLALSQALTGCGQTVRLAATADYAPLAAQYGLEFRPIVGYVRDLMDVDLVYAALDAAKQPLPLGFARRFVDHVAALFPQIVADCSAAANGCDALLVSSLGLYPGALIAEATGLPLVLAHFHPFSATSAAPDVAFPALPLWLPLREPYNLLTHHLTRHGLWQLLRGPVNQARQRLGLPARSAFGLWQQVQALRPPTLYGYSRLIASGKADPNGIVTGYWFVPRNRDFQPPPVVQAFLAAGPPPVFLSFGSALAGRDPDGVTRLMLAALEQTGQRGLIYSAWEDLGNIPLPETVLRLAATPHDWLFPHVAAVVSHGGAGTVAAALRAGTPQVIVPFFGDMRLWAQRAYDLGAAAPPIPREKLSVENLAAAISLAVGDQRMRQRAAALGNALEAEHGAARAAGALLHILT